MNTFPFVGYDIARFGDTAMVSVWLVNRDGRERLEEYETLSAGAKNSARKECIRHAQALNVRWMA